MRVLIADDEALARRRLARLLGELGDLELVGECEDGVQVLHAVRQHAPDVVLLDIHMPNLSGLDALKLLDDPDGPAVVLCTAHAEHALEAFEGGAVDYVLKPVQRERLRTALDRAAARRAAAPPAGGVATDRLPLATARGIVLLRHAAITHARIEGASVVVHTGDARHFTDVTLAELLRRLPDRRFLRVHRRALIGLEHLERLEPIDSGGYLAHLSTGETVEVSRAAARTIRKTWSIP